MQLATRGVSQAVDAVANNVTECRFDPCPTCFVCFCVFELAVYFYPNTLRTEVNCGCT